MVPNILKVVTKAIKEKRCAAIRYYNQREIRIIEPHAIYTNERGELVADCYQTRGFSSSGRPPPFWRPFRLKKIAAISLLKESFGGCTVRVRGYKKVMTHLMFGMLALTALRLWNMLV